MTVGIAAICEADEEPKVVIAADRLVTTGLGTRIEYEHTNSKMEEIVDTDGVRAMGVGAGALSLTDELFYKLRGELDETHDKVVRDVVEKAIDASDTLLRESIERQILSPQGFDSYEEFNKSQKTLDKGVINGIQSDIIERKKDVFRGMNVLIAGVDSEGAHLYGVRENDMARYDSIGYHVVGSGSDPATSSFIRNQYDDTCSLEDAVMSVVEAKIRAEEAQGVGRQVDIAIIDDEDVRRLPDDEIHELREVQQEITEAEKEARQDVLDEKDYSLDE